MGYMLAFGQCCVCNAVFTFNPERVPSLRIRGNREPICRDCIERANQLRQEKGLELIQPLPGAYEAQEEG